MSHSSFIEKKLIFWRHLFLANYLNGPWVTKNWQMSKLTKKGPRRCHKVSWVQIWQKNSNGKCPKLPKKKFPCAMLLGRLSVNLNHLKTPNLTCCVWADTKNVRYASVACDPTVVGVTIRRISRNYVRVNQPLVAQWYNQHYKSIDLLDQHLSSYPISHRTYHSWKHIWWFCFQAAVVNSYILYKETHSGPLPKSYAHIDFRIALAKEMIGTFSMRQSTPLFKTSLCWSKFSKWNNLWVIRIAKLTLLLFKYANLIRNIMGLQSA